MYNNALKVDELLNYLSIALARSIFDAISKGAMYARDNALIQGKVHNPMTLDLLQLVAEAFGVPLTRLHGVESEGYKVSFS